MDADNCVRSYVPADRSEVRRIAYETSFLEHPEAFLADREIVADALTKYFTDYEPESCFVAVKEGRVIGYITGARDVRRMMASFNLKILPALLFKSVQRGTLFGVQGGKLLLNACGGLIRGEFFYPDYCKDYPALLHINLDKGFRNLGLGRKLLEHYERYLKQHRVKGLYLGTMSDTAKGFFMKNGYRVLFTSQRRYLQYGIKEKIPSYIMAKSLTA
jgi:ribosomal protein S18 acetylase RimI-like enzyme